MGYWLAPTGSRVAVEQRQSRRRRSMVLHETGTQERPNEGVVRARGPEVHRLREGDVVLYTRFAGQEGVVPMGSELTVVILEESEVIAVLDDGQLQAAEDAVAAREKEARDALMAGRGGHLQDG